MSGLIIALIILICLGIFIKIVFEKPVRKFVEWAFKKIGEIIK